MANEELRDGKAERALVGCVLIDPPVWRRVQHVPADAFTSWKLETLWAALARLHSDGKPVDYVVLCDQLEKDNTLDDMGGGGFIAGLVNSIPSALQVESYAEIVLDYYRRRQDIRAAETLAKLAYNGDGDPAARAEIAHSILRNGPGERDLVNAWEAADATLEELESYLEMPIGPGEIRDLSTGLIDVDRLTGGLHQGLYAVAGSTSTGKTALTLAIAVNVALQGKKVIYVSPEMSPADLMHRIICAHAQIDSWEWDRGTLKPAQLERVHEVMGWASELPLLISQEQSVAAIEATVHRAVPVDLVILDGIELLTGAESERTHEAKGELSRWAKRLADHRDINCPVWLTLQVPVKQVKDRKDKRPGLGDIYGSSEPEFVTDNLIYLHREDVWEADVRQHSNILDVGYWKCRKKRRRVPGHCQLCLDGYGAVRSLETREEPVDFGGGRWMD